MAQPLVTAPIIGPRRPAHFEPVHRALALKLSAAERDEITEIMST
jgi:aryl-alcohol dehydrogenase-like predicted oxidoreductase